MLEGPAGALYERACRSPLLDRTEREHGPALNRAAVQALLPHRRPFLFIDRVTRLDPAGGTIAARYNLRGSTAILAGHFPGRPVWPGVLQIEAVGQAGLCLVRRMQGSSGGPARPFGLTHVLSARFASPVVPDEEMEIVACVLPDGLFTIVVGQCLQRDRVCSAAAIRGIEGE
jgi:3-hydroxyacyl-[acyl-carrier-protein] dehydratase